VVQVGDSTFTADALGNLVIGTQTLSKGGVLTIDGQVVSLSPDNAVIVNGISPSTLVSVTKPASPISGLIIAGQTLTQGGRITVGGDILSLATSGTGIVVIGTVTIGGGEATSTATEASKKKNLGERKPTAPITLIALQFFLLFIGGAVLLR